MKQRIAALLFLLSLLEIGNAQVTGGAGSSNDAGISSTQSQTVVADFRNRDNSTAVVPAGFLGTLGIGAPAFSDPTAIAAMKTTGLVQNRLYAFIDQLDATGTMVFTDFDASLSRSRAAGFYSLAITITGTPYSLGGGGNNVCAVPNDFVKWAELARQVVAHVDSTQPGFVKDYEIWSEPDAAGTLCPSPNTDATRRSAYLSIYSAAGAAIRGQNKAVRIGGPSLAAPANDTSWITSLVTTASTYPYVDFISEHTYVTGPYDIEHNYGWDLPTGLYAVNQSSTYGIVHYYQAIESIVRSGSQSIAHGAHFDAANTPIYITEYNANNAFATSCCQNDPTYSILYNSSTIMDLLNVAYTTSKMPTKINYFSVGGETGARKYFCIMGQIDPNMDCDNTAFSPYPQYYVFQLFASPSFLNLEAGAHMAASVTPLPPADTISGIGATAFYTATNDSVVIVNPSATAYSSVTVTLNNAAIVSARGTSYTLNAANSTITSAAATLTPISGGYTATLAVPAHSTVALSIH